MSSSVNVKFHSICRFYSLLTNTANRLIVFGDWMNMERSVICEPKTSAAWIKRHIAQIVAFLEFSNSKALLRWSCRESCTLFKLNRASYQTTATRLVAATWPYLIFVISLHNRNFRPTSGCDGFDKYELPLIDQSHNRPHARLLGGPIQQEKKCLALVT